MWINKLGAGVVRVLTPVGPRFLKLSFTQRLYFLWIFRNFDTLPQQVLTLRQQRLIDALCLQQRYLALPSTFDEAPIIGTLERIPVVQVEDTMDRPTHPPNAGAIPAGAEQN
jgi:hypothetical protein